MATAVVEPEEGADCDVGRADVGEVLGVVAVAVTLVETLTTSSPEGPAVPEIVSMPSLTLEGKVPFIPKRENREE